jgi:hypothetical protein
MMTKVLPLVAIALLAVGCDDDDGNRHKPTATPTTTATITTTATATPTSSRTVTPTRTATPRPEPQITFFGLTRADDTLLTPNGTTDDGTPIYVRLPGVSGRASGFNLVIEGKPGRDDNPIGTSAYDITGVGFPDLAIQVSRPLGDGSATVCDDPQSAPGGVPATSPVSFDPLPQNIAAANDFGCRFDNGAGEARARTNESDSCVNFNGRFDFVDTDTRAQFCGAINVPLGFPPGDTTVTARLRCSRGNWSEIAQIVIRVMP